jgi:hypothetical protein
MMKSTVLLRLFVLSFIVVSIGCGGKNIIKLDYSPAGVNLAPCTKSISLVKLTDQRSQEAIGETHDGQLFFSKTFVDEWVSDALYTELQRAGCRVQYHEKEYDFDTDYTVTGKIQELYAKQVSLAEYNATVGLRIDVKKDGKLVFGKNFVSKVNKKTVPSPGINSKVLTETLQTLMREMVPEIRDNLK